MPASTEYVQELIANPSERLLVEVKNWIDPSIDKDKAKIVKGCLALRNYGGGFLVIGFHNETYQPEPAPPYDPRVAFDPDEINALVNSYLAPIDTHLDTMTP